MRISELIESLNETIKEHGDIDVKLHCDHGQYVMNATWSGVSYVDESEKDSYMADAVDEEDMHEGCVKYCEIQAF